MTEEIILKRRIKVYSDGTIYIPKEVREITKLYNSTGWLTVTSGRIVIEIIEGSSDVR